MNKNCWVFIFLFIMINCAEKRTVDNSQISADSSKTKVPPQSSSSQPTGDAKFIIRVLEYVDIGSIKYSLFDNESFKIRLMIGYDVGHFGDRQIGISFEKGIEAGSLTLSEANAFQDALERIQRALPKIKNVRDAFIGMTFENDKGFKLIVRSTDEAVQRQVCAITLNSNRESGLLFPIEKLPELSALLNKAIEKFHLVAPSYKGRVEGALGTAN